MYAPYAGAAGMLLHINEEQFDDTNRQNNEMTIDMFHLS
jgi:hypothetical protein